MAGNVRELQNAVERMVALNSGPLLNVADLPSALQNRCVPGEAEQAAAVAAGAEKGPLPLLNLPPRRTAVFLPDVEKATILFALEQTRGDRAKAAQMLGIGRTTLYRKLKEYKIEN